LAIKWSDVVIILGAGVKEKKSVIRETDAEAVRLARTLIRTARYGAIAVLDPDSGAPLASRVGTATDADGAPLILVSMLSAHTKALIADSRCSLLVGEPGKGDPLAHPRITICCNALQLQRNTPEHAGAERRYMNRHPKAKLYVGLGDFYFFRLNPERASLNAGFGKAYNLVRSDIVTESAAVKALAESEQAAIDHMNSDHRDAISIYARAFADAGEANWGITGIDVEGLDLAAGDETRRVFFPEPLADARDLRKVLVDLAAAGRRALAGQSTQM
jgi:heme iron utilization protein